MEKLNLRALLNNAEDLNISLVDLDEMEVALDIFEFAKDSEELGYYLTAQLYETAFIELSSRYDFVPLDKEPPFDKYRKDAKNNPKIDLLSFQFELKDFENYLKQITEG